VSFVFFVVKKISPLREATLASVDYSQKQSRESVVMHLDMQIRAKLPQLFRLRLEFL
jgi:hypothetical protein